MTASLSMSVAYRDGAARFDGELGSRRAGKILVAAPDGAPRAAVIRFLSNRGHGFVIAQTAMEVLAELKSGGFDLVVSALADGDGMELMRQIRLAMPGLPVILLALGTAAPETMHLDCVTGLRREVLGDAAAPRLASLTARERQVLDLIVGGRANKMIAYELSISPRTVENHRARVMEKLRVRSVAELVRLALSAGDFDAARPLGLTSANDTGSRQPVTAPR